MTDVCVTTRDGERVVVSCDPALSLMENIRSSGVGDIEALCGGCASCGTCHVHLGDVAMTLFPPPTVDEEQLLDTSDHRTPQSRLSCQLHIQPQMPDFGVTVAPAG